MAVETLPEEQLGRSRHLQPFQQHGGEMKKKKKKKKIESRRCRQH